MSLLPFWKGPSGPTLATTTTRVTQPSSCGHAKAPQERKGGHRTSPARPAAPGDSSGKPARSPILPLLPGPGGEPPAERALPPGRARPAAPSAAPRGRGAAREPSGGCGADEPFPAALAPLPAARAAARSGMIHELLLALSGYPGAAFTWSKRGGLQVRRGPAGPPPPPPPRPPSSLSFPAGVPGTAVLAPQRDERPEPALPPRYRLHPLRRVRGAVHRARTAAGGAAWPRFSRGGAGRGGAELSGCRCARTAPGTDAPRRRPALAPATVLPRTGLRKAPRGESEGGSATTHVERWAECKNLGPGEA